MYYPPMMQTKPVSMVLYFQEYLECISIDKKEKSLHEFFNMSYIIYSYLQVTVRPQVKVRIMVA